MLGEDPKLPGQRIRELLEPLGRLRRRVGEDGTGRDRRVGGGHRERCEGRCNGGRDSAMDMLVRMEQSTERLPRAVGVGKVEAATLRAALAPRTSAGPSAR